jgi:LysR family transcriptional regulator, transcriptional activator for dmlA
LGARPPGCWLYLKNGRLEQVLPQFHTPDANIHAVCPQRHQLAARVRAFADFPGLSLNQQTGSSAQRTW